MQYGIPTETVRASFRYNLKVARHMPQFYKGVPYLVYDYADPLKGYVPLYLSEAYYYAKRESILIAEEYTGDLPPRSEARYYSTELTDNKSYWKKIDPTYKVTGSLRGKRILIGDYVFTVGAYRDYWFWIVFFVGHMNLEEMI